MARRQDKTKQHPSSESVGQAPNSSQLAPPTANVSVPSPAASPVSAPSSPKPLIENYELPSSYGTTRLTLMVRDPHWIHAYWEVSAQSYETMRQKLGASFDQAVLVLRMYDVTLIDFNNGRNANQWFDLDVGFHTNNWYVNLWSDGVSYCADLGLRLPDGRFEALVRSNAVSTPRLRGSDRTDMIWLEVKDDTIQNPYVLVESEKERRLRQKELARKISALRSSKEMRRKVYLTKYDVQTYYSRLFPLLRLVRNKRALRAWKKRRNLLFSDLDWDFLPDDLMTGGQESREAFLRRTTAGTSAEMPQKPGGSEQVWKNLPSSPEGRGPERKFFFEIWTELIVHGRTESDADVVLGQKNVPLRNDGTFTLRFALPEGQIPLDFVATSADKSQKRSIATSVERTKTQYGS